MCLTLKEKENNNSIINPDYVIRNRMNIIKNVYNCTRCKIMSNRFASKLHQYSVNCLHSVIVTNDMLQSIIPVSLGLLPFLDGHPNWHRSKLFTV